MPRSPSIVPEESDRDVYLVLEDFGRSRQCSASVSLGVKRTLRQISRRGLKPTDGAVGHVVGSGDVDQSLASFAPCHGFLALVAR